MNVNKQDCTYLNPINTSDIIIHYKGDCIGYMDYSFFVYIWTPSNVTSFDEYKSGDEIPSTLYTWCMNKIHLSEL